jgi:hypothetical protein
MVALDLAQRRAQPVALAAQHLDVPRQIVALSRELFQGVSVTRPRGGGRPHQSPRHGGLEPLEGFGEMLVSRLELRHAGVPFDHRKATI